MCPSGTVVSKKRGAGFLAYPEELEGFLSKIYDKCPMKISIKTRIGLEDEKEWENLLSIYEKYPMEESFEGADKYLKKIKKANRLTDYQIAVNEIFSLNLSGF